MRSTNSGRSARRISSGQRVVLLGLDVRSVDRVERVLVHRLQGQDALGHDAGVGHRLDDVLQVLDRVLRVADAEVPG